MSESWIGKFGFRITAEIYLELLWEAMVVDQSMTLFPENQLIGLQEECLRLLTTIRY